MRREVKSNGLDGATSKVSGSGHGVYITHYKLQLLCGAFLLLLAVSCAEEPAADQASDLSQGVAEVIEAGQRQAYLPLGGSASVDITSPSDGAVFPLQTPTTPVTVEFTLADWPEYPGAGYAVNVYVDNTFVGQQFSGNSVTVQDVPMGYHVIALVLADTTQGGWQEYDGAGARDHVAVVIQAACVVQADCDAGTSCSTYDCVDSLCEYTPTPMCCLSNLQCPPGDVCSGTTCQGCSVDTDCDDANSCTADTCDSGACSNTWSSGPEGICCAAGMPSSICNDWLYCTNDSCNETQGHCESVHNGDPDCCETEPDPACDDENVCTTDQCVAHACTETPVPDCCNVDSECNDQSVCTLDSCTDHACVYSFDVTGGAGCCETHVDCGPGGMSDDNDPSTIDYCQGFVCNHVPNPSYCDDSGSFPCDDDGNVCTEEVCTDNVCTHEPVPDCCLVDGDCDINDPCLDTYACNIPQGETVGSCSLTFKQDCCHTDDDCRDPNDPCTQEFTCDSNVCTPPVGSGDPPSCCNQDSDCTDNCACTTDSCDEDTHTCIYASGVDCCQSDLDCNDEFKQTVDTCDSGCSCSNTPSAACFDTNDLCDDGNPCTDDSCNVGAQKCEHSWAAGCCLEATDCDDSDSCTLDSCNETHACVNDPIASCCSTAADCTDGDVCTTDMCVAHECRFFNIGGCCEADVDCQTGNPCYVGTCDTQTNECQFAVDYDDPTYQCCSTAGDCFDGTTCTTEECTNHQCEYAEAPGSECCTADGDCEDGDPCTYDECLNGLCRFLPPDQAPPQSGIPPLCCVVDGDCASDNDDCTTDACVDGLCSYAPVDPCVLTIPYQQSFIKCAALSVMHWGLDDQGPSTAENWQCSTTGTLGPDKHLLFDWMPQVQTFDSYLLSPWFDLAGYAYVTVQFERAYDHYEDTTDLGLYYTDTGPPFNSWLPLWVENDITDDIEADIVDFTLTAPATDVVFGIRIGAADSYDVDAYEIDSFRVCEGRSPHFTATPPLEVVFVNHGETIGLEVEDQDLADSVQFYLVSAPDFVTLTNQQNAAPTHTVDLSVAPDDPGDAGAHSVVVRVSDGCLVDEITVELDVYQPGGYVVWWPDGVHESNVTALTDAIGAAGRQVQVISDLSLVEEFLNETPALEGVVAALGVYGSKHMVSASESAILESYLDGGGKVYLEGGDVFAFDPWQVVHSYFMVQGVSDGPETLTGPVLGGHFAWDHDFDLSTSYLHNNFLDSLDTMCGAVVGQVTGHGITAVAYEDDTTGYRTIASTIPLAALLDTAPYTATDLMGLYLDFMESGWPACTQDEQCDEGNVCTVDTCVASVCENIAEPFHCRQCRDDTDCTVNEACGLDQTCVYIPGTLRYESYDTPYVIGPEISYVASVIEVGDNVTVKDVNIKFDIDHVRAGELRISLSHGGQNTELLAPDPTDSSMNVKATFDIGRPTVGDMSVFDGLSAYGVWLVNLWDEGPLNGGQLRGWTLHLRIDCSTAEDCDDGNQCTVDECSPESICTHTVLYGQPCDDGKQCTIDDYCHVDQCYGTPTDGVSCNDGDLCTTMDECDMDACVGVVTDCDDDDECTEDSCDQATGSCVNIPVDCDDGNQCTDDSCDSETGCVHTDRNGEACEDGSACTTGDTCNGTQCMSGSPVDCDDGNACTADSCDPGIGCVNTVITCDDDNVCTDDSCDSGTGCIYTNNTAPCDDGDACTEGDTCLNGACSSTEFVICDPPPGSPCKIILCDSILGCGADPTNLPAGVPCNVEQAPCELSSCDGAGECALIQTVPVGAPCRPQGAQDPCMSYVCQADHQCTADLPAPDGLACTGICGTGTCQSGACTVTSCSTAGTPCDGPAECQRYECDGAGNCEDTLSPEGDGTDCSTPDPCQRWTCQSGECRFESTKPAGQACRWTTSCQEFKCTEQMRCTDTTGALDDATLCHKDLVSEGTSCIDWGCSQSVCLPNGPDCPDDGKPCTHERCYLMGTQCAGSLVHSDCDDSNLCTDDVCDAVQGCLNNDISTSCDDGNLCTDDSCDPATGCQNVNNTVSCSDDNACTVGDQCQGGSCVSGGAADCSDGNVCTDDSCDPASGCVNTDNFAACDDAVACTVNDTCAGGYCSGTPDHGSCSQYQGNPCYVANCNPGFGCEYPYTTAPCDDGLVCTQGDTCSTGDCNGVLVNCDDGVACTVDDCIEPTGCSNTPDDGVCDDGNPCTVDTCNPATGCEYAPVDCSAYETDGNLCTVPICEPWMGGCADVQAVDCDDADPCTDDTCIPGTGTCNHVHNAAPCDDGNICTIDDVCSGGVCQGGAALVCDDGNECTYDYCAGSGCVYDTAVLDNTVCDDGSECTTGIDTCQGGVCTGTPVVCDDSDPCTLDLCDPQDGTCSFEPNVPEVCDGQDNNCNTLIDEGVNNGCGGCTDLDPGPGAPCPGGVYVCNGPDSVTCEQVAFQGDGCPAIPVVEAMIHGQVFNSDTNVPLPGVTVQLADRAPLKCATTTYAVTDELGQFHLPVATKGLYVLDLIKSDFITSQREVSVVSNHRWLGEVYMAPLSSSTTTVYDDHGSTQSVVSGDTNVEISIPANTVLSCATPLADCCATSSCIEPTCCAIQNSEIDITITWYDHGDELPGPLPETSYFTYAFSTHPRGLQFSNAVTVKLRNTPLGESALPGWTSTPFEPGTTIPVGLWNPDTGQWEHETTATVVDTTWIEFTTSHFTAWDVNFAGQPNSDTGKVTPDDTSAPTDPQNDCPKPEHPTPQDPAYHNDEGGSQIGRADGHLEIDVALPGVELNGREYALALQYDSSTANPQLYLGTDTDLSGFDPGEFPTLLAFAWQFEGNADVGYYVPQAGTNQMGALVPAKDPFGTWVPTGLYPYNLTIGIETEGLYVWTSRFGEAATLSNPDTNTGRPTRVPFWMYRYLDGMAPVLNYRTSPFGAGWSVPGMMVIYENEAGTEALITDGPKTHTLSAVGRVYKYAGVHGENQATSDGDGELKMSAKFAYPQYIAEDGKGNRYVSQKYQVRKINPSGVVTTIAGCGEIEDCNAACHPTPTEACDEVPATDVFLDSIWDVAADSAGNIYFAVYWEHTIRMVDTTGITRVIAGTVEECTNDCCEPMGLAIDEKEDGVYVYYASRDPVGTGNHKYDIKRLKPGNPGVVEDVLTLGDPSPDLFNAPYDLALLPDDADQTSETGADGTRVLLYADEPEMIVGSVEFTESPVYKDMGDPPAPYLDGWSFSTGSTGTFAGNGDGAVEPFTGGPATSVGIGEPQGLAVTPSGDVYVSVEDDNDMILKIVQATYTDGGGNPVPGWRVEHFVGYDDDDPGNEGIPLSGGVDATEALLTPLQGLLWDQASERLLFVATHYGSVWSVTTKLESPSRRFSAYKTPSASTRTLHELNGTVHTFEATPGQGDRFRITRSTDRWGQETYFEYDGASGVPDMVIMPYGRGYDFTDDDADGTIDSIMLYQNCTPGTPPETPASCDTPLWTDGGDPPVPQPVLLDIEGGDLVSVDFQTGDAPRGFHYDDHVMVRRYHGEKEANPENLQRYVEYEYEDNMVRRVIFKDGAESWYNREYVHSKERNLLGSQQGTGTLQNPIPQDPQTGWDVATDAEGDELWTRLDEGGNVLEVKDTHGRRITYERNAAGILDQVCYYGTESAQECDAFIDHTYDDLGNLHKVTMGNSTGSSTLTYVHRPHDVDNLGAQFGLASYLVTPSNELVEFGYDGDGNLIHVTQWEEWEWASEDQEDVSIPGGQSPPRSWWTYDEAVAPGGQPTTYKDPRCYARPEDECAVKFEYGDGEGNLTRVVAVEGDPQTTADDIDVGLQRNDLGQVDGLSLPYDEDGVKQTSTWTLKKDSFGRTTGFTNPQGQTWTYEYGDPMGQGCTSCSAGNALRAIRSPTGEVVELERDFVGRITGARSGYSDGQQDHFLVSTSLEFDKVGKLQEMALDDTHTGLELDYDDLNRLEELSVRKGAGDVMAWVYDYDDPGRIETVATPDGGEWEMGYDHLSAVTSISELGKSRTATLGRDLSGRVTTRTIGSEPTTDPTWSYVRDKLGRLKQILHPANTPVVQTDVVPDESGNVIEVERNGDSTDTVGRDSHGRITSVSRTYPDLFVADYEVDYDLGGKVKFISSQVGENAVPEPVRLKHEYKYNSSTQLGHISLHRKEGAGAWGDPILAFDYIYDTSGRLKRIELDAPSAAVEFFHDEAGRIDRVDYESGGSTRIRVKAAYADHTSWLSSLTMGEPDGEGVSESPLLKLGYVYDAAGRIRRIDESGESSSGVTRVLEYHDPSRLKKATDYSDFPNGESGKWAYNYNSAGERDWRTVNDGVLEDYVQDNLGMLDKVFVGAVTKDFTFDGAGNLVAVADGSETLEFDYDNSGRVNTVALGGTTIDYRYGPDERRVGKSVDTNSDGTPEVTTHYFTDGLVTYEIDGATTEIQRAYVFLPDGYTPIMLVTFNSGNPDTVYFYLNDHLSTPRIVTDDMGQGVWRARYAPFGQVIEQCDTDQDGIYDDPCPLSQPLRFPGQWDDGIESVWYNWHRFYLPEYGLYGRVDPVFQVGAQVWDYVGGNPVAGIDPEGLWPSGGSSDGSAEATAYGGGTGIAGLLLNKGLGFVDTALFGIPYGFRKFVLVPTVYGGVDPVDYSSLSYRLGWLGGALVGAKGLTALARSKAPIAGYCPPGVANGTTANLMTVTRWGRPGLQPGDWVMPGGNTWWNYIRSFKWQPYWLFRTNIPAAKEAAESFVVSAASVVNPYSEHPIANIIKWLFGQKQYRP